MSDIANVERAVLGSMMQSTNAAHDVIDVLAGPDFESPRHELVFDIIAALVEAGRPHDAIAVADRLNQTPGDLNRVGGHSFLHELVMCVATSASAGYHAEIIREAALKRRLRVVGARLEQLSHGDGPALDMLNAAGLGIAYNAKPSWTRPWRNATTNSRPPTRSTPPWRPWTSRRACRRRGRR